MTYANSSVSGDVEIEVTGSLGSQTLNISSGTSISDIAGDINAGTASTGVSAIASGGSLYLQSEHYGEDEYVSVDVISGSFSFSEGTTQDYGVDAEVTVNGQDASVNGTDVTFNVNDISGTFTMTESFSIDDTASEEFTVGSGGATFALTPSASNTFTVGINSMASHNLGNGTLGYLNDITSGGEYNAIDNPGMAVRIAEEASMDVVRTRANIGSFQNYTVNSMENMLSDNEQSLSSAISSIGDTDYALEVAQLNRQNVLAQAQVSALSILSQQNSSIMNLLGGI